MDRSTVPLLRSRWVDVAYAASSARPSGGGQTVSARPLVVTVGMNPLPCLLVALDVRPSKVLWLATSETEPVARAAAGLARKQLSGLTGGSDDIRLLSAHAPADIAVQVTVKDLAGVDLAYAGGTAAMSAEVYRRFSAANPMRDATSGPFAWYATDQPVRRIDEWGAVTVMSAALSVADIVSLHHPGARVCGAQSAAAQEACRTADLLKGLTKNGSTTWEWLANQVVHLPGKGEIPVDIIGSDGTGLFVAMARGGGTAIDQKLELLRAIVVGEALGGSCVRSALFCRAPTDRVALLRADVPDLRYSGSAGWRVGVFGTGEQVAARRYLNAPRQAMPAALADWLSP